MSSRDWSILKENPHVLCFIISITLFVVTLLNLHSAGLSEDYIQTTGEIINVEEDSKLVHGTRRSYYDFDVSWEMEGQVYEKHFDDQMDYKPEGEIDIWVSPDNQNVRFSSSEEVYNESPLYLVIGAAFAVLGFVLLRRKNGKKKYVSKAERVEQLENRKIYSVLAFLCFAAMAGFFGFDIYKEYQATLAYNSLYADVVIVSIIGMLVCIGLFIHAHVKLKQ